MVSRTPPNHKKMVPPIDPILLQDTVNKVDKCMARLQELQYTVAGGNKVISGACLSPCSTRGYLKTSLRSKQESLRINNDNARKSPPGTLPTSTGDWRRMSLPAMLLGETVEEIIQASQNVRKIVAAVDSKAKTTASNDPKTPVASKGKSRSNPEKSELRARRKREKQITLYSSRSEADPPSLQRAKSQINFTVSYFSPLRMKSYKENNTSRYLADRVSPKLRPWARKTVLFPNPLFHHSSPTPQYQKFGKTKSPVIAKNRLTPHNFLVKSPASGSKIQVKKFSLSPRRPSSFRKESTKESTGAKLRRSFSPSRLASKLVSPLKSRKSVQTSDGMMKMMSGLKQHPYSSTPMQTSVGSI